MHLQEVDTKAEKKIHRFGNVPTANIVEKLTNALNSHEPNILIDLYSEGAVLVTAEETIRGLASIHAYYKKLLINVHPNGNFQLTRTTGNGQTLHFSVSITSRTENVKFFSSTVELLKGKINSHYLHFLTN